MPHPDRLIPTPVEVLSVDDSASTARVVIVGWHPTRPVDVPLAPLRRATGLTTEQLPGTWLEASVNCYASDPADLVMRDITIAPDLPTDGLT